MSLREQILVEAEHFQRRHGYSDRRLCREAGVHHKVLRRLRDGAGVTIDAVERLRAFMADRGREDRSDAA